MKNCFSACSVGISCDFSSLASPTPVWAQRGGLEHCTFSLLSRDRGCSLADLLQEYWKIATKIANPVEKKKKHPNQDSPSNFNKELKGRSGKKISAPTVSRCWTLLALWSGAFSMIKISKRFRLSQIYTNPSLTMQVQTYCALTLAASRSWEPKTGCRICNNCNIHTYFSFNLEEGKKN